MPRPRPLENRLGQVEGHRTPPRSKTAPPDGLQHVIVLEEAHRLLRAGRDGASAHAVELFAGLLAEIRAYGEGVVIAEQIPAKLVPDAVKNTALKVLHRLPAHDDRQVVGAAMNLDEDQSRQVVSLRPGVAAVFADGMDRPLRIRPGGLVIARHPGRPDLLLVKRAARREPRGWWLESDNPGAGAVDSRRFGAVPPGLIEGRVLLRYWPLRRR